MLEAFILFCATAYMPFAAILLVESVLSVAIVTFGNAERSIQPYFPAQGQLPKLSSTTALAFCMRNEDPEPLFDRLHAMQSALRKTGRLQHFRFVLLSDTSNEDIAIEELRLFTRFRNDISKGMSRPLFYRRRKINTGYKAGNVQDFLDCHSCGYDSFVVLDQDSVMCSDLLVRLVSSMERYPQLGMIQTAFCSIPPLSAFSRITSYSKRFSARVRSLGQAWWLGDSALYWGHNAIIRTAPFREHCRLPELPGRPPFGGHIIGHDLMESILLRRAGYDVRLLPFIPGSFEEEPLNLIEALRRHQRWFQGTMQYWFLLTEPGLSLFQRIQVVRILAIYLMQVVSFVLTLAVIVNIIRNGSRPMSTTSNSTLPKLIILLITRGMKTAAILEGVLRSSTKQYGGVLRWSVAIVIESVFVMPMTAIISASVTYYLIAMFTGHAVSWDGQNRNRLGLSWRAAYRALWPVTMVGFGVLALLCRYPELRDWWIINWALSLALSVPFTVLTASPALAQFTTRWRLFTTPEEVEIPTVLKTIVDPKIKTAQNTIVDRAKTE
ncbi:hypothetical protein CKM354_001033400 [Cercospora kikuchii]|uniref:Glucans biosynthesis glucosyltransferase H n=1 Tax=Cercospora kikuchii TaxID=84275 RepID=A0A9P3FJN7_9PEZI|nr:uncharacterized protein CKM354_001033400 [Cercospora kikuchii]GIZ47237.1 hypothetical protein CKM354_001033400 [Cercospora kikuchii]